MMATTRCSQAATLIVRNSRAGPDAALGDPDPVCVHSCSSKQIQRSQRVGGRRVLATQRDSRGRSAARSSDRPSCDQIAAR